MPTFGRNSGHFVHLVPQPGFRRRLILYMIKFLFFVALVPVLMSPVFLQAQDTIAEPEIIVKKGKRTFDLLRYSETEIVQNVVRKGEDSLRLVIAADSMVKAGDTLLVRPWSINEERFAVDDKHTSKSLFYNGPKPTTTLIKIPVNELERIKVKREPFCFIMSSIAAVGMVGSLVGLSITPDSDTRAKNRKNILTASYPVLMVGLTARLGWGKKKMNFDAKRAKRNVWKFE